MFKSITSTLLILLVLTVSITAQEKQKVEKKGGFARWYSMGQNPYILDPENIKVNPALGSIYTNFVWMNLGETNNGGLNVGANFSLTPNVTVGAIFARNDAVTAHDLSISNLFNLQPPTGLELENNIEIFSSFNLNRDLSLGLGLAYAGSSVSTNPAIGDETDNTAAQLGINAGVLARFSGNELEVGASFIFPGYNLDDGTNTTELSRTIIALNARLNAPISRNVSFVPVIDFATISGSVDGGFISPVVANRPANIKDINAVDLPSSMSIGVGLGFQYKIENFLIAGGPAFAYNSFTTPEVDGLSPELVSSSLVFPMWNLGLEWEAIEWLTARMGFVGSSESLTIETAANDQDVNEETRTEYTPYEAMFGLGLHFGNFNFDASISHGVLHGGLANLGGNINTFGFITASYAF